MLIATRVPLPSFMDQRITPGTERRGGVAFSGVPSPCPSQEYFAVRRRAVESADPPVPSHIAELAGWWLWPTATKQIEEQLTDRMKREVARIDARLVSNAGSPGATTHESPVRHARPRLKEWIHVDRGLIRGEGTLTSTSVPSASRPTEPPPFRSRPLEVGKRPGFPDDRLAQSRNAHFRRNVNRLGRG
jgi:hypothetical protein